MSSRKPACARAVVYYFWGRRYLEEAIRSARTVRERSDLPIIAITDRDTAGASLPGTEFSDLIVVPMREYSLLGKAALYDALPDAYESFLFLDTDTHVLGDLSYGFDKAEIFGIAASMAPHYSLDYFRGFRSVLTSVGVAAAGQMQYNTGVIFFRRRADVAAVMRRWRALALDLGPRLHYGNDQPFFTLAMEQLDFNPFTLSPSYNYRAKGEGISGTVRVWHSRAVVPRTVNTVGRVWPPRRFWGARQVHDGARLTQALAWMQREASRFRFDTAGRPRARHGDGSDAL